MSTRSEYVNLPRLNRKYLTPIEFDRLLVGASEGPNPVRDRAICLMMHDHALRVGELCSMAEEHVDLGLGIVNMPRQKRSKPIQAQPMRSRTVAAVNKWKKIRPLCGYRALFVSRLGRPFTRQAINILVMEWAAKGAIPFKVYPHMLRHSCGFKLINHPTGSQNLRQIQDWMGHADIKNTEVYTALREDRYAGLWGSET